MADAQSDVRERLRDPLFRNWVALVLMLDIAKGALRYLAMTVIDNFCRGIKMGSPTGPLCGQCNFRSTTGCTNPPSCPGDYLRRKMINAYRYETMFHGTTMQDCLDDPWAVAKCYMPKECRNKTRVTTDFTGFICLAINNTMFTESIGYGQTLENKINGLKKAREVRNMIMHASPLEFTGSCLRHNMEILVRMLKSFLPMPESAIEDIKKLEHDGMSEQDVVAAFKLKLLALNEFKKELTETIPKIQDELERMMSNGTASIDETPATALNAESIIPKVNRELEDITTHGKTAIDEVRTTSAPLISRLTQHHSKVTDSQPT